MSAKGKMQNHQLINSTSNNVEIFTPERITAAARKAMGGIDLDPASCELANRNVGATSYLTKEDDGLQQRWYGRVWLNHPFSRKWNSAWISKLVRSFESGDIEQACCITFASTSEAWFTPLLWRTQCYLVPRVNYMLPDGTVYRGATKGSVVTYFGLDDSKFRMFFSTLGVVKK